MFTWTYLRWKEHKECWNDDVRNEKYGTWQSTESLKSCYILKSLASAENASVCRIISHWAARKPTNFIVTQNKKKQHNLQWRIHTSDPYFELRGWGIACPTRATQNKGGLTLPPDSPLIYALQCEFLLANPNEAAAYCWRALARQLPILYNREKKAKSVGCKIGDLRIKLAFNIRGLLNVEPCAVGYGCLWMHVELSIHFKRKEGQDKGDEFLHLCR